MKTYAVQHPDMSHALLMQSFPGRPERSLAAHASMYVLRNFDAVLPVDEFVVREVPADTPDTYSIFAEVSQ